MCSWCGRVVYQGRSAILTHGICARCLRDGMFEQRCNMSMVDLEPVEAELALMEKLHHQRDLESHGLVDVLSDMTRFDAERLMQLIENHARYTNSSRARYILDNWITMLPKFRKVMPVEYRRALQEMERAQVEVPAIAAAGE